MCKQVKEKLTNHSELALEENNLRIGEPKLLFGDKLGLPHGRQFSHIKLIVLGHVNKEQVSVLLKAFSVEYLAKANALHEAG